MTIDLNTALRSAQKLLSDNSPVILTATAAAGVIGTAILSAKGAVRAQAELAAIRKDAFLFDRDALTTEDVVLSKKDVFLATWRSYLPAALAAGGTIAAVVGAHAIHTRRSAGFVAALAISERAFSEYKEKVAETIGEKKEGKIQDAIAQDRVNRTEGSSELIVSTGKVLCLDGPTGRYFSSDMETLRQAENTINRQIIHHMYASYNDFCSLVGLAQTSLGEQLGWNTDRMLDIRFSAALSESNSPCIVLDYEFATKHSGKYL